MIGNSQILLGVLLVISNLDTVLSYNRVKSSITRGDYFLQCNSGGVSVGSTFNSPDSVSAMMKDVAKAIIAARDAQISLALVDVPVPVTGMSRNNINSMWTKIISIVHGIRKIMNHTSASWWWSADLSLLYSYYELYDDKNLYSVSIYFGDKITTEAVPKCISI